MRIDYLKVQGDRLLSSLEVDFTEQYPLTVLLGQNGSGKSILLEALAQVFIALEDARAPEFAFQIRYVCNGYIVQAAFDDAGKFSCHVQMAGSTKVQAVGLREFRSQGDIYLPSFIFGYHSGRSERLERMFRERDQAYFDSIARDEKALSDGQDDQRTGRRSAFRRFRYTTDNHMPLGLLALLLNESPAAITLKRDILELGALESVLLTFKRPERAKDGEFFWGIADEYVEFLDGLLKAAWNPMLTNIPEWNDFGRRGRQTERLHLFLPSVQAVSEVVEKVGSTKYFINRLDQLMALGLLERVTIRMPHREKLSVPDHQLSEGEQQFITVMGAVLSSENSESLHLLDEPDSHLNPRWAHDYVHHLTSAFAAANPNLPVSSDLTATSEASAFGTDQVIIATHNPLTIGPLAKEQVRILSRSSKGIKTEIPKYDPKGVGADGLLKMDLFGLKSTLDTETTLWLEEYYTLAGNPKLLPYQSQRKNYLENKLSTLGVSFVHPNPYFQDFAIQMRRELSEVDLNKKRDPESIERQAKISEMIFKRVVGQSK